MSFSEWKTYKLGDFVEVQNGYAFKADDFSEIGIPVIKIKNIESPNISIEGAQCYNGEITDRLKQFVIQRNDILISMTGSHINQIASAVGKVGKYRFDVPALLNQRVGKVFISNKNIGDENYLFYYLCRYETQFELASSAGGSANQANISPTQIKNLDIELPNKDTQQRIASILSSFDDKIELNRQTNILLETIALTVFKEMCLPKKNELPEGWKIDKLGKIIKFIKGKKPIETSEVHIDTFLPQILIETLDTGKFMYANPERMSIASENDILMVMDGASSGRSEFSIEGIVGSTLAIVKPINFKYVHFLYLFLKLKQQDIKSNTTGSSIPHADKNKISEYDIFLPPENVLQAFENIIEPVFKKVKISNKESQILITIRDNLMPKLMRGEIKV